MSNELLCTRRMSGVVSPAPVNQGLYDMIASAGIAGGRMVEIGTHLGVSTAIFAEVCGSVLTVDPYLENRVIGNKVARVRQLEARKRLHGLGNVRMIKKTSLAACRDIPDRSLDFVYIDANHGAGAVAADILFWAKKLKGGAFIGGHDYCKGAPGVAAAVDAARKSIPHESFQLFSDSSWIMRLILNG